MPLRFLSLPTTPLLMLELPAQPLPSELPAPPPAALSAAVLSTHALHILRALELLHTRDPGVFAAEFSRNESHGHREKEGRE